MKSIVVIIMLMVSSNVFAQEVIYSQPAQLETWSQPADVVTQIGAEWIPAEQPIEQVHYVQPPMMAGTEVIVDQNVISNGTFSSSGPVDFGYTPSQPAANNTNQNWGGGSGGSGLAQQKANQAAQRNLRGHVGGGLGGARYEGVGWSSVSAQQAIQQCCYWGTRPVSQIGVSRGSDGCWYACVLYQ